MNTCIRHISFFHAKALGALAIAAASLASCQGDNFKSPPIHLNQNMDFQAYLKPQEASKFYDDKRASRTPVAGTVARGQLRTDDHMYKGIDANGQIATTLPAEIQLTQALVERGRERYNIYCIACHGGAGYADGTVVQRGLLPPPSFHEDRLRNAPIGHFYQVMTNGVRNMMPYASQIEPRDRWAIAAYVRALQLSQGATVSQIPAEVAAEKGWK